MILTRFYQLSFRFHADKFALTRETLYLLEKLCVCVCRNEPTLLVGETGCGKTSTVQYLAQQTGILFIVLRNFTFLFEILSGAFSH